jgi:hypothetical protein
MKKTYNFEVIGAAADGQTWVVNGKVEEVFANVFDTAMRSAFSHLTAGKAVFGLPGVGCKGPYEIHSVLIEATDMVAEMNFTSKARWKP